MIKQSPNEITVYVILRILFKTQCFHVHKFVTVDVTFDCSSEYKQFTTDTKSILPNLWNISWNKQLVRVKNIHVNSKYVMQAYLKDPNTSCAKSSRPILVHADANVIPMLTSQIHNEELAAVKLCSTLLRISQQTELQRQTHVKFASHSHSQEVWTGLKSSRG